MSDADANKAQVRRFSDALNARDLDALEKIVVPDIQRYSPATPDIRVRNFEELCAFLETDAVTFPDNRVRVDTLVAEGDLVGFWAVYSGTQTGPMGPFPPSGRRVEIEFSGLFRFEKGRIAEIKVLWDNVALLTQLGHLTLAAP